MKKYLVILVFLSFGFYSCTTSVQNKENINTKPKNIIFMIGDGMGSDQVYAALTAQNGKLEMARCKNTGFVKTNSADNYITDSGAAVTAFATGKKGNNGTLGISPEGDTLKTIIEFAEDAGMGTGVVATSKVTHATPAGYVAHNISRNNYEEIAEDFLRSDIDVFIGGGRNDFENREDGRNLSDILRQRNYQIVYDIEGIKDLSSGKVAGLLYPDHPPKFSEGRGNMLEISSLKAVELLDVFEKGFFLMIEGSQIDWGGHANDSKYVVDETVDFDRVVGKILDFAEKDGETLVIITADHETGGYAIIGGDIESGVVDGVFCTDHHSSVMVPLFAFGPGAEEFRGLMENTDIFHKFIELLDL